MMVVALTKVRPQGYADYKDPNVAAILKREVINDKKAEKLMAKLQGVKTVLMSGQIKDKAILQAFGFECLCGINEGDERPLSLLMQADVAVENIKKTCQRLMEEYQ